MGRVKSCWALLFLVIVTLARAEEDDVDLDDAEEDEDDDALPHIKNLPPEAEAMDPGQRKLSFKPPQLSEEEEKLNWLPDMMKCDGCLAVAYQFHAEFARGHVNRESNPNWRLSQGDVIDRAERVCAYSTFEGYGITAEDGRNRIKGPGVFTQAGVSQMGGRTPFRLMEMCKMFTELDEDREEMFLYDNWLARDKNVFEFQQFVCIDTMQVCRLQTPEEAEALRKKLQKKDSGREEQTGDHFEAQEDQQQQQDNADAKEEL